MIASYRRSGTLTPATGAERVEPRVEPSLSDKKRALIRRLRTTGLASSRPIRKRPAGAEVPLTFAQEQLWFLHRLDSESTDYNVPLALRLKGEVDCRLLRQAVGRLTTRHEILRTVYPTVRGRPKAIVVEAGPTFREISLAGTDLASREEEAASLVAAQAGLPFDMGEGPLIRWLIAEMDRENHLLLVNMHHIISDGWSIRIMIDELLEDYERLSTGDHSMPPMPEVGYGDYAHWERTTEAEGEQDLLYWRKKLEAHLGSAPIPGDERPDGSDDLVALGGQVLSDIEPTLWARIGEVSRQEGCTPFITILAALIVLLSRLADESDITIGIPVAIRDRPELKSMMGLLINTLAIRVFVDESLPFQAHLSQVRASVLEALEHKRAPFAKVVQAVGADRSVNDSPLFSILFNGLPTQFSRRQIAGITIEPFEIAQSPARFPITVYLEEEFETVRLRIVYRRSMYSTERISSFTRQLITVIEQAMLDSDIEVGSISLRDPADRLPDPTAPLEATERASAVEMLEAQVKSIPDSCAVLEPDGTTVSYSEFGERVEALAGVLASRGIVAGDRVAILSDRCVGLYVAMFAVLRARAVMVPIDASRPEPRVVGLLELAVPDLILEIEATSEGPRRSSRSNLQVDRGGSHTGRLTDPVTPPSSEPPRPDEAAYIFFTSGTEGSPKGVVGRHDALSHFVEWQRHEFDLHPGDRFAQLTTPSFNVLLRDVITPLISGATICLPPDDLHGADPYVARWLDQVSVTALHTVPTIMKCWLAARDETVTLGALRWVFSAGEPLTGGLVRAWRSRFPECGPIVNLYGQTETSMAKFFFTVPPQIPREGVLPAGVPLPETQALVVSRAGLAGVGEPGEIWVRCPYLPRHSLTRRGWSAGSERNPFGLDTNDVVVRTGDRGRYMPDGRLEILGRSDAYIKFAGARVSPDEIASMIISHVGVRACVVDIRDGPGGAEVLVAYVIADHPARQVETVLKSYLAAHLPRWMIPSRFVRVSQFPVTPHGKIDREALAASAIPQMAPQQHRSENWSSTEREASRIWEEILESRPKDLYEDFFDAGGVSTMVVELLASVESRFNVTLSLKDFYSGPTLVHLGEMIDDLVGEVSGTGSSRR